jgi:transposase InsO family protein
MALTAIAGDNISLEFQQVEVPITPPRSPQANDICERLNGTLRRDCLDQIIVINDAHAERVLKAWPTS